MYIKPPTDYTSMAWKFQNIRRKVSLDGLFLIKIF